MREVEGLAPVPQLRHPESRQALGSADGGGRRVHIGACRGVWASKDITGVTNPVVTVVVVVLEAAAAGTEAGAVDSGEVVAGDMEVEEDELVKEVEGVEVEVAIEHEALEGVEVEGFDDSRSHTRPIIR